MNNYFVNCQTVEEVKATYRKLAFEFHPDRGGDEAKMKELNNQYEQALKGCHGQKSTDSEGKEHTYYYNESIEQAIIDAISKLLELKMDEVDILLIGTWVWITGDTKPHKENLKAIGCVWHSKRGCWYFRTQEQKRYLKSNGSLTELAQKYGVVKIEDLQNKSQKYNKKLAN